LVMCRRPLVETIYRQQSEAPQASHFSSMHSSFTASLIYAASGVRLRDAGIRSNALD
jgi:hypothetical protein